MFNFRGTFEHHIARAVLALQFCYPGRVGMAVPERKPRRAQKQMGATGFEHMLRGHRRSGPWPGGLPLETYHAGLGTEM